MKVVGIQLDTAWEDPPASFARARPWITAAARAGGELVVLPEMYACGFSMDTSRIAEAPDGPSTEFLIECAREHAVWICGSVPERVADEPRPYNTLILAGPGGELHRYRKIHPFTFAREHEHYAAGREFLRVAIAGVRCTFFICYDLRFADEFWANAHATDCFVVVANWPARRRHHWITLSTARAIENQAYVVAINRVGRGGELEYTGDSRIVDAWGETLTAAAGVETMLLADIHAEAVREARVAFPVLADRRTSS